MTDRQDDTVTITVADAKRRFSELMSRAAYRGERFVITRNGKPMAALVPAEATRDRTTSGPKGLLSLVGTWDDQDEMDRIVAEIYDNRRNARDRDVDLDA